MKSLKEQITSKCRHFNGTMNKTCDAGITYESVRIVIPGKRLSLPCLKEYNEGTHCDQCSFTTDEEADKEIAEIAQRTERMMQARKAIVDHLGGPWKKGMAGSQGVIDCPCCKGVKTLRFSRAGYNGHIHAHCETKDCVSWME